MNIKMVDLHGQYMRIKSEIDAAIQAVVDHTLFIQGPQVNEFSLALSRYLNHAHVIPCANGTDALQLALMALSLKPGDEVIVPAFTYAAAVEVIFLLGLKPVYVDVDERSFNLNVSLIEENISAKTKAIIPVHLFGQCVDMKPLMDIATRHQLFVIEDNAQSIGADYISSQPIKCGTIGTIGTTSFFPTKNLACFGDGGAVVTTDKKIAERIQAIANHGQRIKYQHELVGVNSRLDTLQAAVLQVKLTYLDEYIRNRQHAAAFYDTHLKSNSSLKIPYRVPYSTHVFHQYTIQSEQRDELKEALNKKGIPSMIYYPLPLHRQPAYQVQGVSKGAFPVAEKLCQQVLSLPMHTELKEEELSYIVDSINRLH